MPYEIYSFQSPSGITQNWLYQTPEYEFPPMYEQGVRCDFQPPDPAIITAAKALHVSSDEILARRVKGENVVFWT